MVAEASASAKSVEKVVAEASASTKSVGKVVAEASAIKIKDIVAAFPLKKIEAKEGWPCK